MIKEYDTNKLKEIPLRLSKDEIRQLKAAMDRPVVVDDDCPEITSEQAKRLKRVNPQTKK